VVQACQSGFSFLAAAPLSVAGERLSPAATLTSSQKTRVRGFRRCASGRLSRPGQRSPGFTLGLRACSYKSASGRREWLNRDPLGEYGGMNLYGFSLNDPILFADTDGRQILILAPPVVPKPILDPILPPTLTPIAPPTFAPPIVVVPPNPLPVNPKPNPTPGQPPHGQPAPKDPICGPQFNPPPNPNVETCDLYPSTGKTCTYWCKKSQRFVDLPGHPEGCPPQWTGDPYHPGK
jgi:RHS repeat-associated protein